MKEFKHNGRHIIVTDAEGVFHHIEPGDGLVTAYPDSYGRITGSTEDSVFRKVFNNPARRPDGRYHIPELQPKAAAVLRALFED